MKVTRSFEVDLTVAELAALFTELSDDDQAQFLIEAARIAAEWPNDNAAWQWSRIGRHLRDCTCSTREAREMVCGIADALNEEPKR